MEIDYDDSVGQAYNWCYDEEGLHIDVETPDGNALITITAENVAQMGVLDPEDSVEDLFDIACDILEERKDDHATCMTGDQLMHTAIGLMYSH